MHLHFFLFSLIGCLSSCAHLLLMLTREDNAPHFLAKALLNERKGQDMCAVACHKLDIDLPYTYNV